MHGRACYRTRAKRPDGKRLAGFARNISDKAARAIADTGGVIGVMVYISGGNFLPVYRKVLR